MFLMVRGFSISFIYLITLNQNQYCFLIIIPIYSGDSYFWETPTNLKNHFLSNRFSFALPSNPFTLVSSLTLPVKLIGDFSLYAVLLCANLF